MGTGCFEFQTATAAGLPAFLNGTPAAGAPETARIDFAAERAYPGIRGHQLTAVLTGVFESRHGLTSFAPLLIVILAVNVEFQKVQYILLPLLLGAMEHPTDEMAAQHTQGR